MKQIKSWLPVYASAEFSIDKPDNWDALSEREKQELFLSKCDPSSSSLCWSCSNHFQTDHEVCDMDVEDVLEYEEEDE
jgi:hypothetical protein